MEETKCPGIEKMFWIYEILFSELDQLVEMMNRSDGQEGEWIEEPPPAPAAMRAKLMKYYTGTFKSSVYDDEMILDPRLKLYLTMQAEWSGGQDGEYSGTGYSAAYQIHYLQQYEKITPES